MAANGDSQTVSEYIVHHLTNLTYGKLPGGYERYDGSVVAEGGLWAMAHTCNAGVFATASLHALQAVLWSFF